LKCLGMALYKSN